MEPMAGAIIGIYIDYAPLDFSAALARERETGAEGG
jgi:hypothetical protein